MPEKKKTQAIILRRTAFGEADLIVHFFSREFGRMGGIAKSARASQKRFGGALEPGTYVELLFTERHGASLVNLGEARVLRPITGITKSLEQIHAMERAVELALSFLREHQPVPDKFDLLNLRLSQIGEGELGVWAAVNFEIEWLRLAGFAPRLKGCVVCGDEEAAYFDYEHGGTICNACGKKPGRRTLLDDSDVTALKGFGEGDWVEGPQASRTADLIHGYIEHVLGKQLKTRVSE